MMENTGRKGKSPREGFREYCCPAQFRRARSPISSSTAWRHLCRHHGRDGSEFRTTVGSMMASFLSGCDPFFMKPLKIGHSAGCVAPGRRSDASRTGGIGLVGRDVTAPKLAAAHLVRPIEQARLASACWSASSGTELGCTPPITTDTPRALTRRRFRSRGSRRPSSPRCRRGRRAHRTRFFDVLVGQHAFVALARKWRPPPKAAPRATSSPVQIERPRGQALGFRVHEMDDAAPHCGLQRRPLRRQPSPNPLPRSRNANASLLIGMDRKRFLSG